MAHTVSMVPRTKIREHGPPGRGDDGRGGQGRCQPFPARMSSGVCRVSCCRSSAYICGLTRTGRGRCARSCGRYGAGPSETGPARARTGGWRRWRAGSCRGRWPASRRLDGIDGQHWPAVLIRGEGQDRGEQDVRLLVEDHRAPSIGAQRQGRHKAFGPRLGDDRAVRPSRNTGAKRSGSPSSPRAISL